MRPGLERIETLLAAIGNPERAFRIVQVGGTNGKGSISAMLAAILKAAGRRVGLYTSPHLVDFRERIRVERPSRSPRPTWWMASRPSGRWSRAWTPPCSRPPPRSASTTSRARRVDVAVLEVGLGGRLDATTVGRAGRRGPEPDRLRPPGVPRQHARRDRGREGRHHPSRRGLRRPAGGRGRGCPDPTGRPDGRAARARGA